MDYQASKTREAEIGLEVFYTATPGTGGRLRKVPEDFVVEEISKYPEKSENGKYTIATVTSTNWEMNRLVRMLSKSLRMSRNRIGFAGTKDKRAVTKQLMSFEAPIDDVRSLRMHQVTISDAYQAKKHLTIGDLIGNSFDLKIRDCTIQGKELEMAAQTTANVLRELNGFPNFFGVQRFGALRPVTHLVGKYIVKGDIERAVMVYVANPNVSEPEEAQVARRELERSMDFKAALSTYSKKLSFERTVIAHLARNEGDYSGAIRSLPPNLQMMFVHAYQSYLFNKMLSQRIRKGLPLNRPIIGDVILPVDRDGIPNHDIHIKVTEDNIDLVENQMSERKAFVSGLLFGSESEFAEGEAGAIEKDIIEAEGIGREDFIIPEIPGCSSKGSRRELLGRLRNLSIRADGSTLEVSFALDKGCYATSLLREFMKADVMDY
ncbi:MAG: tRNA pseudouridine(13) synthase TruD [Methanomassiliicoccales archaeon]|nr:tRNA pseudouridine(13) synthase TruD [Methanomassiliicoccales archaeon]